MVLTEMECRGESRTREGKWAPDGGCRKQSPCPECSRHQLERVGKVETASPNGPRESP